MRAGLLALNKPAGISSRDCVNRVVRACGDKRLKVGHAGTLDPMATGVLLVAIGEATRLVEQFHELDKRYVGCFEFGKSSDTLDADGEVTVVPVQDAPTRDQLETVCRSFIGPQVMQRPPRVSAIKIKGQRAYDLARQGAEFEIEARPVAIYDVELIEYSFPRFQIALHCGSGTYVRSLGRDIAEALGTSAIMTSLVRTAVGPFSVTCESAGKSLVEHVQGDAPQLNETVNLDALGDRQQVESLLYSPLDGLVNWTRMVLDEQQTQAIRHGRAIRLNVTEATDRAVGVDSSGQWVALLDIASGGHTRPVRVFQTMMATNQPKATSAKHNPES